MLRFVDHSICSVAILKMLKNSSTTWIVMMLMMVMVMRCVLQWHQCIYSRGMLLLLFASSTMTSALWCIRDHSCKRICKCSLSLFFDDNNKASSSSYFLVYSLFSFPLGQKCTARRFERGAANKELNGRSTFLIHVHHHHHHHHAASPSWIQFTFSCQWTTHAPLINISSHLYRIHLLCTNPSPLSDLWSFSFFSCGTSGGGPVLLAVVLHWSSPLHDHIFNQLSSQRFVQIYMYM